MVAVNEKQTRNPKRILLTGGCGFIGSNFSHWLMSQSEVELLVILDCLGTGSNFRNIEGLLSNRCHFVQSEFGSYDCVLSTLEKYQIDTIVHLAGETHVDRSYTDPNQCTQINVMQIIPLLQAAVKYGKLNLFLHMSTDEVYGDIQAGACDENTPLNPTNPYSASKAAAEQFVKAFYYSYGLPIIIMRCNNVYGPMQETEKVIPKFIQLILQGRPLPLHGGGSQTRNWVFVRDVCEAYWVTLTKGRIGEIYNIGSKNEASIKEIAQLIYQILAKKGILKPEYQELVTLTSSDRPHNDKHYHIDWSKITKELGWTSKTSFIAGMESTVEDYVKAFAVKVDVKKPVKFLLFGHKGWIGQKVVSILQSMNIQVEGSETKPGFCSDEEVKQELLSKKPTHVVSLLGRTHGPGYSTIDYLENGIDKLQMNIRDNLYAPMILSLLCSELDMHYTYLGTGCIFHYDDDEHCVGGLGCKENDSPSFFGSSYSVVKGYTDRLMHSMKNTLNARIRMPVSDDSSPRNFITKISTYEKVVNIPNSVTVLPELLPILIDMALKGKTGTVNLVNPGPISHNEILDMYREIVDPKFTYKNFSVEEQARILKAGRSNCALDTSLLQKEYSVDSSHVAVRKCLEKIRDSKKN